jgi:peroxiredoxin
MVATICLFTCALVTAQSADRSEWLLTPRLSRGQELVYEGTFKEEIIGRNTRFNRSYRLETTVFILDTPPGGYNAALVTVLEMRALSQRVQVVTPCSVRLELARVNLQGQVSGAETDTLLVPLDGPPTIECGAFVPAPRNRVGRDPWEVAEPGRPPRFWQVVGTERINTTTCVKLEGRQQSEDWDWEHARADKTAWRRRDTVWLAPALGITYRVERVIERREPARREPTQVARLSYQLQSRLTYPGQFYEDRRREITKARDFAELAAPYIRQPGQFEGHLDALLKKIDSYVEHQPGIDPYRKAVLQVKRRVEAAKRGEAPPDPVSDDPDKTPARACVGQRAPDFVATDLLRQESVHLHRLLGRPILLVFFNPSSPTATPVLRFANTRRRAGVTVLGMSLGDDVEAVKKQHASLQLTFPIVAGKGFHDTYGVDATPRFVLLDAQGIVRGTYTGWGSETAGEINEDLQGLLARGGR